MEEFDIWQYHSTRNSFELPYPYRIFIVFQHEKLTFRSFWGYLGTNCLFMASFYRREVSDIQNPNYKAKIRVSQ